MFKLFFRKEKYYLKLIINELLELNISEEDITFINNDLYGRNMQDKSCYIDMSIKLNNGEIVIIEMQNITREILVERFDYYISSKILDQVPKGMDYTKIKKVYGIFFLNGKDKNYNNMFTKISDYDILNMTKIRSAREKNIINLTKLDDYKKYNLSNELINFLNFIASKSEEEMVSMIKDDNLKRAYETVKELNADPEIQTILDMQRFDDYEKKQDVHEAREQGKEDELNKTVINMHKQNLSFEDIAKYTDTNISKIKDIIENFN
ncbi:MAG: Rpn family recombination-promoting nuclease/putative transposase [Mycoplasmatota bacterium]